MHTFIQTFIENIKATGGIEYVAVFAGILSVWYSRKENILVYPIGLINTVAHILLSAQAHLPGEVFVNLYYTILSIVGWIKWMQKNKDETYVLHISSATKKEWMKHLLFFGVCFIILFATISLLKIYFAPGAIPLPDAAAGAAAFTGMWLMIKKKLESWWWWIATNLICMPLYLVKGYALTSVYYFILLIMAISGLIAWKKKLAEGKN